MRAICVQAKPRRAFRKANQWPCPRLVRLVRFAAEIPDVPGTLAALTAVISEMDSNIVDIVHQRAFRASSGTATVVVLQMRGEEQVEAVLEALRERGYEGRVAD